MFNFYLSADVLRGIACCVTHCIVLNVVLHLTIDHRPWSIVNRLWSIRIGKYKSATQRMFNAYSKAGYIKFLLHFLTFEFLFFTLFNTCFSASIRHVFILLCACTSANTNSTNNLTINNDWNTAL